MIQVVVAMPRGECVRHVALCDLAFQRRVVPSHNSTHERYRPARLRIPHSSER